MVTMIYISERRASIMLSQQIYLKRIYPVAAIIILVFSILARVLWVGPPYIDLWETISSLYNPSHPEYNPVGAYFFWGTMATTGLLTIAMIVYVHPRLAHVKKGITIFGTFWMLVGAIGFLLVGLVPQHTLDFISPRFHEISAVVALIGALFGAAFYGLAMITGKPPLNRKLFILITVLMWGLIGLIVLSAGGAYLVFGTDWAGQTPIPNLSPLFSIAICEKVGFWVWIAYMGLIGALIPDHL